MKVDEVKAVSSPENQTAPYTAGIVGLGTLAYFAQPAICVSIVGGYLTLLTVDLGKNLSVLKFDKKPAWSTRVGDIAYFATVAMATAVAVGATKAGMRRLKESLERSIVLKENPPKKE